MPPDGRKNDRIAYNGLQQTKFQWDFWCFASGLWCQGLAKEFTTGPKNCSAWRFWLKALKWSWSENSASSFSSVLWLLWGEKGPNLFLVFLAPCCSVVRYLERSPVFRQTSGQQVKMLRKNCEFIKTAVSMPFKNMLECILLLTLKLLFCFHVEF